MDTRGEEAQHDRGMRARVFHWAGRKVSQFLESDSEPSSSSTPGHQDRPSQHGSSHGQNPILPQQSDHLRLLFKVRHRSVETFALCFVTVFARVGERILPDL